MNIVLLNAHRSEQQEVSGACRGPLRHRWFNRPRSLNILTAQLISLSLIALSVNKRTKIEAKIY